MTKKIKATLNDSQSNAVVATYASVRAGDTLEPLKVSGYNDITLQVSGVFDGGTADIKGSIDGLEYFDLTDSKGNVLSFDASGLARVTEGVCFLVPVINGDTDTELNIQLLMRSK